MPSKTLSELFEQHTGKVADRWSSYLSEYDRLLAEYRDKPVSLLEIGVLNGGSLEIWARYFEKGRKIVGCDIDPKCGELTFDDPRIEMVIGDANSDAIQARIRELAAPLDIVIDDGSHKSADVVKSFIRYFPLMADGGVYVVEDLHTSYWAEFEGGLFTSFSSMAFFKRLADMLNAEHWEDEWDPANVLADLLSKHGIEAQSDVLQHVHSIEFRNSLCILRKESPEQNSLGHRVVAGSEAIVNTKVLEFAGGAAASARTTPQAARSQGRGSARAPNGQLDPVAEELDELTQRVQAVNSQLLEKEHTIRSLREQATERDHFIQSLSARVSSQEQSLQREREDSRNLKRRLDTAHAQLADLQSGFAYGVLVRYRKLIERILPPSSGRRQFYSKTLRLVRTFFSEGLRGLSRRLPLGHRGLPSPTPWTRGAQSSTSATLIDAGFTGSNQDKYAASYAELMATAANTATQDFVPLTQDHLDSRDVRIRAIAFYLPQYHPIPENDEWWGKGFTEWTNVAKAVPQFVGHFQPRLPGELGFYDLRIPEIQLRQIELARKYGIHGFCIHYYWFNGKRLLERPLDQFVDLPGNDFPFCLCWANENWTRRWDGQEDDVLIAQKHSKESDIGFIRDVAPYFRRDNYIRVGDRPLLLVYRVPLMPHPRETAERWREYCHTAGIGDPYLVAAQTFGFEQDPREFGFDAAVEFPPHNIHVPRINYAVQMLNRTYQGSVHEYIDAFYYMTNAAPPDYPLFKTVFPSWDNEARKPGRGNIFAFSTPAGYQAWLTEAGRAALSSPDPQERLLFINAWNEWGEGAYLEPDRRYGYAYLQATMDGLKSLTQSPRADGKAIQVTTGPISKDTVVVYQMGKVGSMSIVDSLKHTYSRLALPVRVYHVHNLNMLDEIEAVVRTRANPAETLEVIKSDRALRRKIDRDPAKRWKVISLVRDPVARNVAWFFQSLDELIPDWRVRWKNDPSLLKQLQQMFLDTKQGNHETPETWFDIQMLPVFGIDVFAEEFPKEVGYKIYPASSRVALLLIRLENLDHCAATAIREFLGIDDFVLINSNMGDDKEYADLYRAFKKLPIPETYLKKIYSTRFARHFYTPGELDTFTAKWLGPK